MKSHICNGHYMFGNTFVQPDIPGYNNCFEHRLASANRSIPPYPDLPDKSAIGHNKEPINDCCYYCANDISSTKVDVPYADPNDINNSNSCNCNCCLPDNIIRDPLTNNIINISTELKKILKVTLYATDEKLDKTIEMETGKRYAVTYASEHGYEMAVGYLEVIGDSIPDNCIFYMNTVNKTIASTGYIGIDCSTEGHADKRRIYISTIRNIEDLTDKEEPTEPLPENPKTVVMKLEEFLDAVERGEITITKNNTVENVIIE